MAKHHIFVFGTLKKGQPNHFVFSQPTKGTAKFLWNARTQKKWPLVIAGVLNYPALLFSVGIGKNVLGEVYEVDDEMLAFLDEFVESPTLFTRDAIDVRAIRPIGEARSIQPKQTWTYFAKDFNRELLSFDHLDEYKEHADCVFIHPQDRFSFMLPETRALIKPKSFTYDPSEYSDAED